MIKLQKGETFNIKDLKKGYTVEFGEINKWSNKQSGDLINSFGDLVAEIHQFDGDKWYIVQTLEDMGYTTQGGLL